MLQFIIRKIISKKWMVLSLLIGNVLLFAIASSCALYENAILQKMLTSNLAGYLEEKDIYPGLTTMRTGVRSGMTSSDMQKYNHYKDLATHLSEDMGVQEMYFIQHYYKTVPLIPEVISLDENNENGETQAALSSYSGIEDHIQITAGRMNEPGIQDGHIIEVIIPKRTLIFLDLMIGEVLTSKKMEAPDGEMLAFKVVGVFEPTDASDPYWYNAPSTMLRTMVIDSETFIKAFVELEGEQDPEFYVEWASIIDYKDFKGRDVEHMLTAIEPVKKEFNNGFRAHYEEIFEQYLVNASKLKVTLLVLQIPILVLLILFIFMVSGRMLEMEQKEISIFKSRGASKRQILLLYLEQSVIVAGVGLVIGLPLGFLICQVIGSSNAFLEFVGRTALPVTLTWKTVLFSLVAALLAIGTMVIPAFRYADVTIVAHTQQKAGKKKRPLWQKLFLDVIMLALALYIYYLYLQNTEYIAETMTSGSALGPFLYLGSSIFILGAGLLVLRIFPLLVKLIYLIGRKHWSPALYASFLHILRDRGNQGFLMVFLIMTMSLGIFNAQAARTINVNGEQRISYMNGADIVIKEKWENTGVMGETGDYIEPDFSKYEDIENVASMTRVLNDTITVMGPNGSLKGISVMAINTKEFGNTAWFKDGLLPIHWYNYLNAMSRNPNGILMSSNAREKLGVEIGDSVQYYGNHGHAQGIICGFVDYWPAYRSKIPTSDLNRTSDHYQIIANFDQVQSQWDVFPYEIWMKIDGSTQPIYDWASERGIRFATFKDTKADLIRWKNDPVTQGTNGILTVGFIVVLILCAVGFLIFWILSIRARELQFGIFRAMGMSMREILAMLGNEQLFISGISLVMGAVIGRIAAKLYVPMVQLAYTTEDTVIPLEVVQASADTLRLYLVVGIVVAVCMAAISILIHKIQIAQALKLGED